jgi:hypothetical protein
MDEIIDLTLDDDIIVGPYTLRARRQTPLFEQPPQIRKPKPKPKPKPKSKPKQIPPRRMILSEDLRNPPGNDITAPQQQTQRVRDYTLKPLKQYQRPYFSPYFDSYEMDYVNTGKFFDENNQSHVQNYLFVININTKYLISVPLPMGQAPSVERTIEALNTVFQKLSPRKIDNIRGDADTAFGRTDLNTDLDNPQRLLQKKPAEVRVHPVTKQQQNLINFLRKNGVRHIYLSSSKFINKNRCVDRVIRTIRDMIGLKTIRLLNPDTVQHIVDIYNESPHSAYLHKFSPSEAQNDPEIEGAYIRYQKKLLEEVKEKERQAGLNLYKPGNILLIYIPKDKTPQQFDKRRRNFSDLAVFITYKNGNVLCELLDKLLFMNPMIQIPVYYTKFVCEDIYHLPANYKDTFIVRERF